MRMKPIHWRPSLLLLALVVAPMTVRGAIDRRALVTRHNLEWNELHGQVPLGNGEFCFNADATGLQTFGGSTLAHWAWHSAPLPPGSTAADIPPTGTVETGRLQGPMKKAAARRELDGWMFRNPHPVNLARLRWLHADGTELKPDDITTVSRRYDLWTGLHTSRFTVQGEPVTVETCVHPALDLVAVRAESPLLREGRLVVALDFPYPGVSSDLPWVGDWNRYHAHTSDLTLHPEVRRADLCRTADTATYRASVGWGEGGGFGTWPGEAARQKLTILSARYGNDDAWLDVTGKVAAAVREDGLSLTPSFELFGDPLPGRAKKLQVTYALDGEARQTEVEDGRRLILQEAGRKHTFRLGGDRSGRLEFVCAFAATLPGALPTVTEAQQATAGHWQRFWTTGGAIDLSQSRDPRWRELERRIVLSQYQMAAQSAGSWPSAETGLMGVDFWSSQFHLEMVWWHLAHYGLWDRWPLAERALGCYRKFLPVAVQLAGQFNYRGAKWGKQVGPEGRTAPWEGSFVLHWQQPHPLFFAELEYRLRPDAGTLAKWKDIVFATADYMADFPIRDDQGVFHLQPIMPPSEQGITHDTVFDLAYWRWGLDQAQRWRERLGLAHEPRWTEVRRHLAPLPMVDGLFVHSAEWHDTYTRRAWEHPDPIGVLGMLPPLEGVDRETAHRTVLKVWQTWDWNRCWGWDFPWMAMAAARVGEPQIAIEALLKDAGNKNRYDARGVNTGGPCPYLPGNGGLLYVTAMMAAGWDGAPTNPAPGFPQDGSWAVRWEGLQPAP